MTGAVMQRDPSSGVQEKTQRHTTAKHIFFFKIKIIIDNKTFQNIRLGAQGVQKSIGKYTGCNKCPFFVDTKNMLLCVTFLSLQMVSGKALLTVTADLAIKLGRSGFTIILSKTDQ